jgi:Holliday junction resolvasome RuvABC endonuclease subunit
MHGSVMGVDPPSTGGFGVVVLRRGEDKLPIGRKWMPRWYVAPATPLARTETRQQQLFRWHMLLRSTLELFPSCQVIAVERPPFGGYGMRRLAVDLSECVGVLKYTAAMVNHVFRRTITVHEFSSGTIQKVVVGNGRAGKLPVQRRLMRLIPHGDEWTEHERDAAAAIITYLRWERQQEWS